METCGTCRFWGDEKDKGYRFRRCLGVYSCERFSGPGDGERLESFLHPDGDERWDREEMTEVVKQRAYTIDGSGYYNALKCREDFGCVLWQSSQG